MAVLPLNYYDLTETFPAGGCVVCSLVERDVHRFLDSHLYEYVNTPETHAKMRGSRGLCATHSANLVEFGASVLGITILHAAIMDELLKTAGEPTRASSAFGRLRGSSGSSLANKLEPDSPCMACAALERAEAQHIGTIAEYINDDRLREAYAASAGLCLPHFKQVLRAAPDSTRADTLTQLQLPKWKALKAELDMLSDKYDANHNDEAVGAEADSWRRALELVSGKRDVFGVRRST
ncbi:MAG: DUF6062 family protein [Chloroflexi bacterium]|nr:DUF6062 family protein [Chloroflexota bacterium]MCC6895866.1 hypothetical protein [Anaerolineae bacterium]